MRTIWRLPSFGRARGPFDRPLRQILASHKKHWCSADERPLRWRARRRLRALEADSFVLALAALAYDVRASVTEIVTRWRAGEPTDYESDLVRTVTALQMRIANGVAFKPACGFVRFDPWQVAAPLGIGLESGLRALLVWPLDFEALASWLARHEDGLASFHAYVLQRPLALDRIRVAPRSGDS